MRYLNKIIFLNSAHIPMAEIKLDGNVHFAGTQGVGKSTIQRAILFFYNADQMKLGISKEKKSFAEYYFEYPNSYLIYEVMKNGSAYMVVAFINRGRINFRFVDAAYRKEMFMDEAGVVYSDWTHIREHIDSHTNVSPIVDTLEEYRNIIYGNRNAVRQQFRKYSITESSRYQNIPRTIQNVFLNSKLDAEVIKKTIIDSMTDVEMSIDINAMRSLISEFGQKYRDVLCWETKNAKGEVVVRKQANNVIDSYLNILYIDSQTRDLCAKIRFAQLRDAEALPLLEEEQSKLTREEERIQRLIREEKQRYDAEQGKLLRAIGALEEKLRMIVSKKADYKAMNIEAIVALVETEPRVKEQLSQQEKMLQMLTKQFESITAKYEALIEKIKQNFQQFSNSQDQRKNELTASLNKKIEKIYEDDDRQQQDLSQRYAELEKAVDEQIDTLQREMGDLRTEQTSIRLKKKFGAEIDAARNDIKAIENDLKQMEISKKHLEDNRSALQKQWDMEEKNFQKEMDDVRTKARAQRDDIEKNIADEEAILKKQEGSLYAWLEENKRGWEENIGKVTDENILYDTTLQPTACQEGRGLYGVELDLSRVKRNIRTPEEIRKSINKRREQIVHIKEQAAKQLNDIQAQLEKTKNKYLKEVKQLRDEINILGTKIAQGPHQLKMAQNNLTDWEKKEQDYQAQKLAEVERKMQETNHLLQQKKQEKENNKAKKDREWEEMKKASRRQIKTLREACDAACSAIDDETKVRQEEKERQIADYRLSRDRELAGQGADTQKLQETEQAVARLNAKLAEIARQREHYYNYKKDQRELFDRESDFRREKKELEEKKAAQDSRFQLLQQRHLRLKEENSNALAETRQKIGVIKEGMAELDSFVRNNDLCPLDLKDNIGAKLKTDDTCKQLVANLIKNIYNRRDKLDGFKNAVNLFKGNFSVNNIFNFKTELNSNEDYADFADNLKEFIENDMVETYKERISNNYADILQRISKETGDVMRYGSYIEQTIRDINRDFEESNFAGVIKKISLKRVESSEPLMQLLVTIKNFCDENAMNMGELNIFSDERERSAVGRRTVELLFALQKNIEAHPNKSRITLDDTFRLQFRIQENDNDTGWVEKISNVGSDGTDVLVKAMVNIMLINVFKKKMSRRFDDYQLHCMMDEIGRLHPANVKGILDFANKRHIFLINSSPISYTANDYRYNYLLSKDGRSNTKVRLLMAHR